MNIIGSSIPVAPERFIDTNLKSIKQPLLLAAYQWYFCIVVRKISQPNRVIIIDDVFKNIFLESNHDKENNALSYALLYKGKKIETVIRYFFIISVDTIQPWFSINYFNNRALYNFSSHIWRFI